MDNFWNSLELPWQSCFEEAWGAFCAGSLPIGAVVTDSQGKILSRGRNRRYDPRANDGSINYSKLAHAELNALIKLPEDDTDRHNWILYTTTEPCPLCMGAIYMSGLRKLHYASRDPWAGSTNLLGKTPYLSRKKIQIFAAPRRDLENIMVGMVVYTIRAGRILKADSVLQAIQDHYPEGSHWGEALYESQTLHKLQSDQSATQDVYNHLVALWQDDQSDNSKTLKSE